MTSLENEVISKVKEAIVAKLNEMEANSSDDIIDYIMLLVTIKKSSSELVKGLEFLMEENTSIFVKWLSTFIKKLQKVTVSTAKLKAHDELQVYNEVDNLKKKDEVLTSKSNKDDLEEKDEFLLKLSADEDDISNLEEETEVTQDKKSDLISVAKSYEYYYKHENTLMEPSDIEAIIKNEKKCATNVEIKKHVLSYQHESNKKLLPTNKNHYSRIDFNHHNDSQSQQNISDVNNTIKIKKKRPRISLDSDNEDNESCIAVEKVVSNNTKLTYKPHPTKTGKTCFKYRLASKVAVVNRIEPKLHNLEIKKKLYLHDLVTQKVDHQRGALALDTAFQYIQEQMGATDKDIAVIQKWRDYAVGMLRSNKKV